MSYQFTRGGRAAWWSLATWAYQLVSIEGLAPHQMEALLRSLGRGNAGKMLLMHLNRLAEIAMGHLGAPADQTAQ